MKLRALVTAVLLVASLIAPSASVVAASDINRFVYLGTAPAMGVSAYMGLGDAAATVGGSQSVWVAVGGSHFLDIIQVGAMVHPDGTRHFFAAWGRGVPNGADSLYIERDLGPTDRSWHSYTLTLSGSGGWWSMYIDGVWRLDVSDSFRNWYLGKTTVANEAEPPNARLGGTQSLPAQAQLARVLISGVWRLPATGSYGPNSWSVSGQSIPASTVWTFGPDWLKVWMP